MQQNRLAYRFIVLDGVEGCGKTTQVQLLAESLQKRGEEVVVTYEPGGTAAGEAIRSILLDSDLNMDVLTEALLFCASRAQHLQEVILPALEEDKVVVCDRFSAATAAYQGYAGELGMDLFLKLDEITTSGRQPDMTIILDLDPAVGRSRQQQATQSEPDRIERRAESYHQRVRQGFLTYARRLGDRAIVIPADRSVQEVHRAVLDALDLR